MPKQCRGKYCCCCCNGKDKKKKQAKRAPNAYQTFMSQQLPLSTQLLGYKLDTAPDAAALRSLLAYNANAIETAQEKRASLPAAERANVKLPKRIDPGQPMTFKHVWMHAVQQWYNTKGRDRADSFTEFEPGDTATIERAGDVAPLFDM